MVFDIHCLLSLFSYMTKSAKKDISKVNVATTDGKKSTEKEIKKAKKTSTEIAEKNLEAMAETTTKISAKKIISAKEEGEMAQKELDKMKEEKTEVKHENKSADKKKIKISFKKVLVALTSLFTLLVILMGGAWIWVLGTPEYAYYQMYTAVADKDFDKFIEFVDTNATAEDLVKQESEYLKQNNIDDIQAKFSIKGTLEYTFYQYIESGNFEKVLPYNATDGWKMFENNTLVKGNNTFTVNLKTDIKFNETEGVFGYRKMVFSLKGNKWVITQLIDNPGLDNAKKEAETKNKQ